jgi:autotransporter-associated beta strand protein
LITCGSVGSGSAANFQLATLGGLGLQASINVTATGVDLVVVQSTENLVWTGDGGANLWDFVSTNWLDGGMPAIFTNGDSAIFDYTSTNTVVNLTNALQPAFVTVNAAKNYTFTGAGKIAGTVTFTKTNSGTLLVLTTNDYNGVTTISQGTVQVGNGVASGQLGTGLVQDNGQLVIEQGGNSTLNNIIGGSGSLTQAGGGTLTLAANNTYNGGTTISAGVLQIGSGGTIGGGNVADGTSLIFNNAASNVVNGVISGGGNLIILGGEAPW